MNEQNITNIIDYLDQNPDQTIEVLVQNLLNEGYPVEDIKAALDRQGISPLVIPGYKETIVYSAPKRSFSGKLFIIAAVFLSLIMLGVVIYIVYSYVNQTTPTTQSGGIAEKTARDLGTSQPASPTPTSTEGVNITSILKEALAKEDYKIVINNITVYTDNGSIARLEKNDGKIYLDWSSAVAILDIATKTYKIYYGQTPEVVSYSNSKSAGIVPLEVIAATEAGTTSWKQIDPQTYESTSVPKQSITIDPETNLITRRIVYNPDGSVSKDEQVSYEKTTLTRDIIEVPSDYRSTP